MSALQRTSTSETLSPTLRGPIYQNAVCPSLDDKTKDIQGRIKALEDKEKILAVLYGKDKDTFDPEEVRMMARRRANETKDTHDSDEMEKLHKLRLELSKLMSAQNVRSKTVNEHHDE